MKRYKKLALAALIVGALSFGQASAAVQVNPIPGLPADFIKGADISVLQANINDISQRYNKDVIVVETAYGYTTKNFDQMANEYSAGEARRTG